MLSSALVSLALSLPAASAAVVGFNYGSLLGDNNPKQYNDFKGQFTTAQGLAGTNGQFSSARLYTMIQGNTQADPISALQAAIDTKTSLLLGMWASGDGFANELQALKNAIQQYPNLGSQIIGLSVGSEDLYRETPTGIANKAGVGQDPQTLLSYINQVKSVISGGSWKGVKVGHVDTWNAWTNTSDPDVAKVITAVDFLGVDEYPYYQTTVPNSIDQSKAVFDAAYKNTTDVAQGKEVWVTETGYPTTGPTSGQAVASVQNAQSYWNTVGCPLFGNTNTWWYTLNDGAAAGDPVFSVVGSDNKPAYDLSCKNIKTATTSSASSTSTGSGSTGTGSTGSSTGSSSSSSPTAPFGNSTGTGGVGSGSGSSGSGASSGGSTNSTGSGSSASGSGSSGSGSSSGSSGSGSGSSGSGSGSASGSGSSPTPFPGAASTVGSSAAGIFGAVAAAIWLL